MADLNLNPEPLNRMKSRLCVENSRSELRFGRLKNIDERFLKSAFWRFRVTFPPRFEGRRVGWGRVGGLLFRTHSQQRARASRGQKEREMRFLSMD